MTASLSAKPPSLNPFIFPSDTTFRFVLLIVAILGASLHIFSALLYTFWIPRFPQVKTEMMQCYTSFPVSEAEMRNEIDEMMRNASSLIFGSQELESLGRTIKEYHQCSATFDAHFVLWGVAGLSILLLVAVAIYWLSPQWKIKRESLRQLDLTVSPELEKYLQELCQIAGLREHPTFLTKSLNGTLSGLAFGRPNQYYVVLPGGLVTYFSKNRAIFRAIVLHELAHIRNRDVNKTYFTLAMWWAFVWVAVVPFVLVNIWRPSQLVGFGGLSVVAFMALVYLIRNSILRSRELYADARAVIWDNNERTLQTFFGQQPRAIKKIKNFLGELHPDPRLRANTLEHPNRLFSINFENILFAGIVAGLVWPGIDYFFLAIFNLHDFYQSPADAVYVELIRESLKMVVFLPLLACATGIAVWRAAFAEMMTGQQYLKQSTYLSFALCIGLLLGRLIAFDISLQVSSERLPAPFESALGGNTGVLLRLPFEVAWVSVFLLVTFLFCQWLTMSIQLWTESVSSQKELNRAYRWSLVIASILLTLILSWVLGSKLFLENSFMSLGVSLGRAIALVIMNPVATAAIATFWIYPLTAIFLNRRRITPVNRSWAFTELRNQYNEQLSSLKFSLKPALKRVLLSSLVFSLLATAIMVPTRLIFYVPTREPEFTTFALLTSLLVVGIIIQMVVGAVVSQQEKSFPILQGLFTTFMSGSAITICSEILEFFFNLTIRKSSALDILLNIDLWVITFCRFINMGFLFSLPVILAISAFSSTRAQFAES